MRPRTFALPLALFTIVASVTSQAPEARSAMGLALRSKDEYPEHAAELLRRAWLLCEGLDNREGRRLQGEISDHLRELDRHGVRLVKAQSRMLRDLRRFAAEYLEDGWFRTAGGLIATGETMLPEGMAEDRRELERRRAEEAPRVADLSIDANAQLLQWFRDASEPGQDTPVPACRRGG